MGWDNPPVPWEEFERRLSWRRPGRPDDSDRDGSDRDGSSARGLRPVTRLPDSQDRPGEEGEGRPVQEGQLAQCRPAGRAGLG